MIEARGAALLSLVATSAVVIVKLYAGIVSGAVSVLAEATQSGVDVLVAFGVFQAIKVAHKPPDEDHQYGHGKVEVLMSAAQLVLILGASGFIIFEAYQRLLTPEHLTAGMGIAAMIFSVVVNGAVAWHLWTVGKRTRSLALQNEVLHLNGDTLASLGVLVGLLLFHFTKVTWIDPAVAITFTVFVVIGALKRMRTIIHDLSDGSLPPSELELIKQAVESDPESRGHHNIRSRSLGSLRVVELHVLLDDHLSFVEAHDHAELLESKISEVLGGAIVTIHYEPYESELRHRREHHAEQ